MILHHLYLFRLDEKNDNSLSHLVLVHSNLPRPLYPMHGDAYLLVFHETKFVLIY